ncbi:hypothetical protein POX35_18815, partial [Escherichia fergusonii]
MKEKLKSVNRKMTNDGEEKSGKMKKTQDAVQSSSYQNMGNDSNLLIVFYVQIMPDDFVMQLHR